ncbi:MAG: AAA family ATPase [Roseivirga sp.]
MKKLPIGIQSIEKILGKGEYIYVDKTQFALELIEGDAPHYFLSRPRRFGKSLFLSTLEEIFKGHKELFKGCDIYDSSYDWPAYPILYFDLYRVASHDPTVFEEVLKRKLQALGKEHQLSIDTPTLQEGLEALITGLSTSKPVVVLVDEYDSPIIKNIEKPEVAEQNRAVLQDFFGMLKSLDRHLKFTFITGISKFTQVSLFSDANHLDDITMYPQYATMMGYTEEELMQYFEGHMQAITEKRNQQGQQGTDKDVLAEIKYWYNGYRFSEAESYVYNPFSTLKFMETHKAESHWYATGTPSFLMHEIAKRPQAVITLGQTAATESRLAAISKVEHILLPTLMFQAGYLTIQDYDAEYKAYQLDFPNQEVREAFFDSLLEELTEVDPLEVSRAAKQLRADLAAYQLEAFIKTINIHFAKIPYHVSQDAKEGFYQAVFFTLLEKSGIRTQAEVTTNRGRIDLVAQLPTATIVFELKRDETAALALDQARRKEYNTQYAQAGKALLVLGINFSSATRDINDWLGQLLDENGEQVRIVKPATSC